MKIGVLTFHHTNNYGGLLQAISLCKTIAAMGHNAEIIDYRPISVLRNIYSARIKSALNGSLFLERKTREFKRVLSKYHLGPCVINERQLRKKYASRYDMVITGSDEVWNTVGPRGFDTSYFLDFVQKGRKRISYAATAGRDSWSKEKLETIKRELSEFHGLSVRDESTAELVSRLGITRPQVVLDPTFLIKDWKVGEPPIPERYLFVAGQLPEPEQRKVVKFSERNRLRIVSGGYLYSKINSDFIVLNPLDWVSAIGNSEAVMTSLFHAMAFSINLGTSFSIYVPSGKETKIRGLFESVGYEHRSGIAFGDEFFDARATKMDLRNRNRADSLQFLEDSLNN